MSCAMPGTRYAGCKRFASLAADAVSLAERSLSPEVCQLRLNLARYFDLK